MTTQMFRVRLLEARSNGEVLDISFVDGSVTKTTTAIVVGFHHETNEVVLEDLQTGTGWLDISCIVAIDDHVFDDLAA